AERSVQGRGAWRKPALGILPGLWLRPDPAGTHRFFPSHDRQVAGRDRLNRGRVVSNPDVEIQKLMRRVDHFAARLNPRLSAIAIVLAACLLGEITLRLPTMIPVALASDTPPITLDAAGLPIFVPSPE